MAATPRHVLIYWFQYRIAGFGLARRPGAHLAIEGLMQLVTELNARTRFYVRRLRGSGDVTGADNVLAWQTGYPFSVNLSRGYPRYNPGEFSANDLLERGEPDVCLFVGSFGAARFTPEARTSIEPCPRSCSILPRAAARWRGRCGTPRRYTASISRGRPIAWTRCRFRCGPRCRPFIRRRGRAAGYRAANCHSYSIRRAASSSEEKQAGPDGGGEGGTRRPPPHDAA